MMYNTHRCFFSRYKAQACLLVKLNCSKCFSLIQIFSPFYSPRKMGKGLGFFYDMCVF